MFTFIHAERSEYISTLPTFGRVLHIVCRTSVYQDVLNLYQKEDILSEYPLDIEFQGEIAIDHGGVTRDMFSAFWDKCYQSLFDGATLLVPMLSPQADISTLPLIGRIISHGYLSSGFLPIRIALPCLLRILCGIDAKIPNHVLQEAFLDYISHTEKFLFREALCSSTFSEDVQESLLNTLSRFGCRQLPKPSNLLKCLQQIANFEFCIKPAAAISLIHSGIPPTHLPFWKSKSVDEIHSLYKSLAVSANRAMVFWK